MKGQVRNIYPGGNTPFGFYSYYNYISPQRKAKKIFCIKGGPGTGKSTLMRNVGDYFLKKGEDVDFFYCSSDPTSLDGVLVKKRCVAIVDGTAPHIIDPHNPGAVDEIVNLGDCWNERGIRQNREEIISCNQKIGEMFSITYGYLKCAWQQYDFMAKAIDRLITAEKLEEAKRQLQIKTSTLSAIRRAESRIKKESALGAEIKLGQRQKFFASAITPYGIRDELQSLIDSISKIIMLEVPVGFRTEILLRPVSERIVSAGFDVEEYYCPMDPERKLEHIISAEADVAIITCNKYHSIDAAVKGKKFMNVRIILDSEIDMRYTKILEDLQSGAGGNIVSALAYLKTAKEYHDILEEYYIVNMDFDKIKGVQDEIIGKIMGKIV